MASCIDLGSATSLYDPAKNVFDDALIKLVQDIWCDGTVNMHIR